MPVTVDIRRRIVSSSDEGTALSASLPAVRGFVNGPFEATNGLRGLTGPMWISVLEIFKPESTENLLKLTP
jgi:hypothetical protein